MKPWPRSPGKWDAYFMVDMAHLGGLVAGKVIPSPVPHADFVTFTCYKTMMGGRGGVILGKEKYAKKINHGVFPGMSGHQRREPYCRQGAYFQTG